MAACGSSLSCLDYEERKTFSLTYKATDGGGQSTTTHLIITLEDVNDNPPLFDRQVRQNTLVVYTVRLFIAHFFR